MRDDQSQVGPLGSKNASLAEASLGLSRLQKEEKKKNSRQTLSHI